jgi:hypothetical protein
MIRSFRLALLMNVCTMSVASAQPLPSSSEDFSAMTRGRELIVVEESGVENTGRLLRVTPDTLTMTIRGKTHTFPRQQVTAIFERGDSVKNGTVIGLVAGAAIGLTAGASKSTCGRNNVGFGLITAYLDYSPCTLNERVGQGLREGALLGLLGAGIGAAVDAVIPGRRVLYQKQPTAAAAISIAPSLAPSAVGLLGSVSW